TRTSFQKVVFSSLTVTASFMSRTPGDWTRNGKAYRGLVHLSNAWLAPRQSPISRYHLHPVSVIASNARNGTASNPIAAYASRQSGCAAFWIALPSFDTGSAGGESRLKIPLRPLDRAISGPACSFFASSRLSRGACPGGGTTPMGGDVRGLKMSSGSSGAPNL